MKVIAVIIFLMFIIQMEAQNIPSSGTENEDGIISPSSMIEALNKSTFALEN